MRVLCCLDGTNVQQVSKAVTMRWPTQPPTLGILYVTDTGPRHDIDHICERFLRSPGRLSRASMKCGRQSTPPRKTS